MIKLDCRVLSTTRGGKTSRYFICTLKRTASDDNCSARFREPRGHFKSQMASCPGDEGNSPRQVKQFGYGSFAHFDLSIVSCCNSLIPSVSSSMT